MKYLDNCLKYKLLRRKNEYESKSTRYELQYSNIKYYKTLPIFILASINHYIS